MTARFSGEFKMDSLSNRRRVKPLRARADRQSGASLVEVVLLMPLMMLIFFGMVDLGRYIFLAIEVHSAARAGAQFGAQSLTNSSSANWPALRTAACNDVPDITPCGTTGLVVTPSTSSCWCANAPGTVVSCGVYGGPTNPCSGSSQIVLLTVNTSATFNAWIAYPPFTNITISATAVIPTGQY